MKNGAWLPAIALIFGAAAIVALTALALARDHLRELQHELAALTPDEIAADPELLEAAMRRGAQVYRANCAECHGASRTGIAARHAPNLADDHRMYAGADIETFLMHATDIEKVILYGLRADHPKTMFLSDMPPFGAEGRANLPPEEIEELEVHEGRPVLSAQEIGDLTEFVLFVSGRPAEEAAVRRGQALYFGKATCFDCHAFDYRGDQANGSADLTLPQHWLYGSDRAAIAETITFGRLGMCPAFEGKLAMGDARAAALYVMNGRP